MENYYLITFENTSMTMAAEAALKGKGVNVKIMPTPAYITKSCGISIKIEEEQSLEVKKLLESGEVRFKSYYFKNGKSLSQVI